METTAGIAFALDLSTTRAGVSIWQELAARRASLNFTSRLSEHAAGREVLNVLGNTSEAKVLLSLASRSELMEDLERDDQLGHLLSKAERRNSTEASDLGNTGVAAALTFAALLVAALVLIAEAADGYDGKVEQLSLAGHPQAAGNDDNQDWPLDIQLQVRSGSPDAIIDQLVSDAEGLWGRARQLYDDGLLSSAASIDYQAVSDSYLVQLDRAEPNLASIAALLVEVTGWVADVDPLVTELERELAAGEATSQFRHTTISLLL